MFESIITVSRNGCIGESYACAVKTAEMTFEELQRHVEYVDQPGLSSLAATRKHKNFVVAIGHFLQHLDLASNAPSRICTPGTHAHAPATTHAPST